MRNSTPLSRILKNTRQQVLLREKKRPLESFKNKLEKSDRNFTGGYIFECKKASPSEGLIRENFDIQEIAQSYKNFASAISVLTDQKYFQGDLKYLKQISDQVSCPVLCKDFFISAYQVYEARYYGADMILLMLSVLDNNKYLELSKIAEKLNLDILTEIHSEQELERALELNAKIIGVNARDFKTLKVNLDITRKLLPKIPKDKIRICESGIKTHQDTLEFRNLSDGFLVGTSLMRQPRLDLAVRELVFGRIKICGLTREQDALNVYNLGASYGGLIFAEDSPRKVSLEKAKLIKKSVPLNWVGVFVNSKITQILECVRELDLFTVQLHGEESEEYICELRKKLDLINSKIEIWKRVILPPFLKGGRGDFIDRYLFDTPHKNLRGGTGETFDWSKIPPNIPKDKIILSGGLGPENIKIAEKESFWLLDVNSKLESAPGIKELDKIKALFDMLGGKPSPSRALEKSGLIGALKGAKSDLSQNYKSEVVKIIIQKHDL